MADPKKLAMIIGIMVLLPLFFGLFVDAVYPSPEYDDYCKNSRYAYPQKAIPVVNCSDYYSLEEVRECQNEGGEAMAKYDENGCQLFDRCDFCSKEYNEASQFYNRNIFLILAPLGLMVIIIGLYLKVDYLGAGLMFGGLITLFYATLRYFSDMSKLLRAIVILVELLIIMWIGYKKIDQNKQVDNHTNIKKKRK